jgi:hypothetical protein
VAVVVCIPALASGQTNISLAGSATSTLTAAVAEQADVSLPGALTIDVNDVNAQAARPNQVVSISNIVLASATKQLRLLVRANASSFTAPAGATTTWDASAVSWTTTQSWTNGAAAAGTLSASAFNTVATCDPGVTSCSTTRLKFTLAPNSDIRRSGTYTLAMTWKIESIGS